MRFAFIARHRSIWQALVGRIGHGYATQDAARADVFDYIERFYNPIRRNSTVCYLSQVKFEKKFGLS